MKKLILIRPSIDYSEIPENLRKFFPLPTGNFYREPPMGILYVASSCVKEGIDTKIIDQYTKNISNEEVLEEVIKEKPDFVGFTLTSSTWKNSKALSMKIKEKLRKCLTIVGGPWVTMTKGKILNNSEFDFAVYGEGEITAPELIKNHKNRNKISKIKGLIFRYKDKIIVNPPREFIKDLDSIPKPAYNLININDYARGKTIYVDCRPVDYICATRGCPYACAFCSSKEIWQRKYRVRKPSKVINEMEFMIKEYGTKGFHFRDDNLTVNKNLILGLCKEIIKRKLSVKWMCESRVDTLDEEIISKMKEAGCTGVWFGIESGSQRVLDYLKKGITLNQIRKTTKLCQKYKMKVGGSFMIGVPIETEKTIKKTFKFAKSLKLENVWINFFQGVPNCEIYEEIKKKKLYKYSYNGDLVVETSRFSSDQIYNIVRRMNFYFELKRFGLIFSTHSISEYPQMFLYILESMKSVFKSYLFKKI